MKKINFYAKITVIIKIANRYKKSKRVIKIIKKISNKSIKIQIVCIDDKKKKQFLIKKQ